MVYCECLIRFKHSYATEIELTYFERFGTRLLVYVKYFEKTILTNCKQSVRFRFQMQTSVYLATSDQKYLLWALGISLILIYDYLPILNIVFTFGLPIENSPDDSIFLTGLILIGTLLNYSSFFVSSSSYSSTLNASAKRGCVELREGWGILKICLGHCPN